MLVIIWCDPSVERKIAKEEDCHWWRSPVLNPHRCHVLYMWRIKVALSMGRRQYYYTESVTVDHIVVIVFAESVPRLQPECQINTTGATSGAETAYHSGAPECDSCCSIFSFMCMFYRSLFVLLYLFFWPLCCLFFDIRILITPLVSFFLFVC